MSAAADVLTLKRSHSPEAFYIPHQPHRSYSYPYHQRSHSAATQLDRPSPRGQYLLLPRTYNGQSGKRSMPLQTASRPFQETMPSFMTVYGQESDDSKYSTSISTSDAFAERSGLNTPLDGQGSYPASAGPTYSTFQHYRTSFAFSPGGSTNSSPTTTASLVDSSSAETPGSTPNTPASIQSLSFNSNLSIRPSSSLGTPPVKKARNLKNLAVNTSSTFPLSRPANTATFPVQASTDSSTSSTGMFSPAFLKPSHPPRKRATNLGLTIATPATEARPVEQVLSPPDVPPTPAFARPATLRHFQSTPSLPIFSATLPPEGGMRLPPLPSARPLSSFGSEASESDESRSYQNYDLPNSQEEKPDAYPNGPVCIYDPHVYLYFEPTAQQAAEYDVIFNVASEVKNPFTGEAGYPINFVTLAQAAEALAEQRDSSPSTPKATEPSQGQTAVQSQDQTEYIHVPWEHNTDIVKDLYPLVKVVDDRVQRGKRVLIHCQCGVSRSASLVVAYGIYKNPDVTVQDAYDAVKQKSQWIGPNMNLIMQLQEFRSGLRRSDVSNVGSSNFLRPAKGFQNRTSTSGRSKPEDSPDRNVPQTAPLAPSPINTESREKVSPGPSSAPSDFHWPSSQRDPVHQAQLESATGVQLNPEAHIVNTSGQVVQNATAPRPPPIKAKANKLAIQTSLPQSDIRIVTVSNNPIQTVSPLESPRSAEFGMSPVQPKDLDDTLGITSPRAAQFAPSPSEQLLKDQTPIMSPRNTEFGMNSVLPPDQDHAFGLTSPRATTFTAQMPHRAPQHEQFGFSALLPSDDANGARARAELRSQMGMSSHSNTDLRASFAQAAPAPHVPSQSVEVPAQLDLSDALMSPRATEFTKNPFEFPAAGTLATQGLSQMEDEGGSGDVTPKPRDDDPRSPPIRGAQPITRNIFDVL